MDFLPLRANIISMELWQERYHDNVVDAATAVRQVARGSHVFVGSGCAEPWSRRLRTAHPS